MRDDSTFQLNHDTIHTLHFHQVNVGRGGQILDIALQQALEARALVIMVQKPWTMQKLEYFFTKSHPGYKSYIPIGSTESRPRAITFTIYKVPLMLFSINAFCNVYIIKVGSEKYVYG